MPYLHYCNTHYSTEPPTDINPLILQRFKDKDILCICARENMVERIKKLEYRTIQACGIWDIQDMLDKYSEEEREVFKEVINKNDVIVIIGRNRIDECYKQGINWLERAIRNSIST